MFEHGDSWYYLAFAEYIKTGIYPFQWPFIYQKPTTIASPLYSLIILPASLLPHSQIYLHLVQLIMLGATSYILYKILRMILNPTLSALISGLFILIPANIIFASYVMTEIPSQLGFTYFVFRSIKTVGSKSYTGVGKLVFLSAILTLLKYQFFIVFAISFLCLLYILIKNPRLKRTVDIFFSAFGLLMIIGWIFINHNISGVWGLSDTTKIRFHAAYVNFGRYFPSKNNPEVIEFRKYIPETVDKYSAWWDLHPLIHPQVNGNWLKIDEIIGNVGLAAIRENPLGYIHNTGKIFFTMHTASKTPWWEFISLFGYTDPVSQSLVNCRTYGNFNFCKPVIMTSKSYDIWNTYAKISGELYKKIFPFIALYILFPSLLICLISKNPVNRLMVFLYVIPLLFTSLSVTPEPRYLFPFYPLMIAVIARAYLLIRSKFLNI